jgi:hypothetical protein
VVSGLPDSGEVSYTKRLGIFGGMPPSSGISAKFGMSPGSSPGWSQVLPPSFERWMIWPNQVLVWLA